MPQDRYIAVGLGVLALIAAAILSACAAPPAPQANAQRSRAVAAIARGYSQRSFVRVTARMDRAMLALARRHDPRNQAIDPWGRPIGWATLNLSTPPTLGFVALDGDQARRMNALLPTWQEPPAPARPFVLTATGAERERAVYCLTQAIYFEAAMEPQVGQEAVAQTVLNRMRHPDFPRTVCGVVYQGSQRTIGCQFSFTCDGSRNRAIIPAIWERTRQVAERALAGHVQAAVGTATFYHADYVFPSWSPTLVKIRQIGAHIFYRFPGPQGRPAAFNGRWRGGELLVSMAGPPDSDVLALEAARNAREGGDAGMVILQITDPTRANGLVAPTPGQVLFGRRLPSREEIADINRRLAEVEAQTPASPANPDLEISASPWSDLPRGRPIHQTPAGSPPSTSGPAPQGSAPRP